MDPIFETSFSPGTLGIRAGDVQVEILGEFEGKVIVTCARELAAQNEWTRRWDLEQARREHYEQLGERHLVDIHAAHDERIAKEIADREAAELTTSAADKKSKRK